MIIRLITATNTVLFSPGYAAVLGPLTMALNLRSKNPFLELSESAEVDTPLSFDGGAGGV